MKNLLLLLILFTSANSFCSNKIRIPLSIINDRIENDTLRIFHNDTTAFNKIVTFRNYPCSKPQLVTYYELIAPKDGVYYFIYNEKKQLFKEGKYSASHTYNNVTSTNGGFYDSKTYSYRKNGKLDFIHYQEDGRNSKTEYFDSKKRIKRIRYRDTKSSDTSKIEYYSKGKLKKTRIYKSFSTYDTVRAK